MSGAAPRLALVTGGTRGIGLACATALAVAGWQVLAAARRPAAAALPPGAEFAACDVADAAAVRALFGGLSRLDLLVTAAGLAGADPAEDPEEAHWQAIRGSNLDGTWRCCMAARRLLPEGTGRIVTIASVLGLRAVPDQVAYSAAKHGVVGLTRALALQLAPRGITVNAICPGWVRTGMAEQRWRELAMDEQAAAAGTPTGRITSAEEVAALVLFLASPAAGNLTGQAIGLDGGASL